MSRAEALSARNELAPLLDTLTPQQAQKLMFDFYFWGRPAQFRPGDDVAWFVWLLLTGRGWGKNYSGANNVNDMVKDHGYGRVGLGGRTAGDVRDVMVEGPSGILELSHPDFRPLYEPSKRRLTWPNGAVATTYTADKPDQLRGPQHDLFWGDEIASWKQVNGECEAWNNMLMGMRVGPQPRVIATTTPRPTKFMRTLIALASTFVTSGHSDENKSNLHPDFYSTVLAPFIGTRLGRQELAGEILEDVIGALWTHDLIDQYRVTEVPEGVELTRVPIGVDPSGGGDEIGIVAVGKGSDGHYYMLRDRSLRATPNQWGSEVVKVYHELKADRVVGEKNYGGDMVEATIRNVEGGSHIAYTGVTASRGKAIRAEPISALYERGLVHHVGMFPELEDQMTSWTQDSPDSPDRMDALVWACTDLLESEAVRFS